jgi:glycine hydroxymethyltransferase
MCNTEYAQDIDRSVFPGMQGGPLMHTITAKAVCFKEALHPSYRDYCRQIVKNSRALAETLLDDDLDLVSGGTDNHLVLLNLTRRGITGLEAEQALEKAGITVNKNTIPSEKRSPFVTSGLRIGTPAVTSRGMKVDEMRRIGEWIALVLRDITNTANIARVKQEVEAFASVYPLHPEIT